MKKFMLTAINNHSLARSWKSRRAGAHEGRVSIGLVIGGSFQNLVRFTQADLWKKPRDLEVVLAARILAM